MNRFWWSLSPSSAQKHSELFARPATTRSDSGIPSCSSGITEEAKIPDVIIPGSDAKHMDCCHVFCHWIGTVWVSVVGSSPVQVE